MITINKQVLHDLKPFLGRWENYLEHYSNFEWSFEEFLKLDKISYDDKIFVVKKLIPKRVLVLWACLCAESVLHLFEEKFPEDKRPHAAITSALIYLISVDKNSTDAYAAANVAADAAVAAYAARSKQEELTLELLLYAIKEGEE